MKRTITVKGARENNLKNVTVDIPRDALTVVTGVSGSGKSSLAFDVIYAEGQRLFLDSISTYSRRFIPQLKRPEVDMVTGLSSIVAIEQKKGIRNPRSTVGTMTDISDYLRLLFASFGTAHCPYCGCEVTLRTMNQIVEHILSLPEGTQVEMLAPVYKIWGEDYPYLIDEVRKKGFKHLRIDGDFYDASQKVVLDEKRIYRVEVIIDRLVVRPGIYKQVAQSIESGIKIGDRVLRLEISSEIQGDVYAKFYDGFACSKHHILFFELEPYYFSPNDPDSACVTCGGLGTYKKCEARLFIEKADKSIRQGALNNTVLSVKHPWKYALLYSLGCHYGFSMDIPWNELPPVAGEVIFYGTQGEKFPMRVPPGGSKKHIQEGQEVSWEGIVSAIDRWYRRESKKRKTPGCVEDYVGNAVMVEQACPDCGGRKLKTQRSLVTIEGHSIFALGELSIKALYAFFKSYQVLPEKAYIGEPIMLEISNRLKLLLDIGLDYLNLNRAASSLSGGEIQRVRLSTQIGSGLMGMLYVLDEPSIGLHPRDSQRIIRTLETLRDNGNTVIVVEHDLDTIRSADYIVEMGPGAGAHGGQVVAAGLFEDVLHNENFLTGKFLTGEMQIPLPGKRRSPNGKWLRVRGARQHNLQNINVDVPLGVLVCVTGVSGSGKSSLINDILHKKLKQVLEDPRITPGEHGALEGCEHVSMVIDIDQSPIGRGSRSNPATYAKFYDHIQRLFADTPAAREKGYSVNDFSFNHKYGGRCEECQGEGMITTPLQFMSDVETICPVCKGKRFNEDMLEVTYKGKNISDVLEMTIEEAQDYFKDHHLIAHRLKVMNELGLGYLRLGQSSTTLSGGEAQRIKLATELGKIKRGLHNLYILDEPTTGLHLSDIQRLLDCLNRLVDTGHTVLVIEHNLEVIKCADWIIDLGPLGGDEGGRLVAAGTPQDIIACEESFTGHFLKDLITSPARLERGERDEVDVRLNEVAPLTL